MPICQPSFVSRNHANIRMAHFHDSRHTLSLPKCDSILPHYPRFYIIGGYCSHHPAPNRGPILPAGLTHSLTDPRTLYTTPHASGRGDTISTSYRGAVSIGVGTRNLLSGRRATAVGGHPTQPDSQPKSISVALQTATQTRFMPFP